MRILDFPSESQARVLDLIKEHFPWGQDNLPHEEDVTDPNDQLRHVGDWLSKRIQQHRVYALALIARIVAVLDEMEKDLPSDQRGRFFYRLDTGHLLKSPESILEKMIRDWKPGLPFIAFNNIEEMPDLARFRVVVNFLSDARDVKRRLEEVIVGSAPINGEAARKLREEFLIKGNCFDDKIDLLPTVRQKGERCYKGVFHPKLAPQVLVEMQIVTILSESWDKKDHYLIYENRRAGRKVEKKHEITMFSISELLFVADESFDRIKSEIDRKPEEYNEK